VKSADASPLMAMILARRVSQPLSLLVSNSQRMGQLDLAGSDAISSHLEEVNQLAEEQERMRIALDAFSKYVPVELVRAKLTGQELTPDFATSWRFHDTVESR
jgi:hypothetical protein